MHLQWTAGLPVVANVDFSVKARRMRGARRPLRHRQELAPEDGLRQLRRRCRADPGRARRPHVDLATADPRTVSPLRRITSSAMSASSCGSCPRVAALDVVAEPLVAGRKIAAVRPRKAAARLLARLNLPRALATAAVHLFRRRAAARQHRPRLHHRIILLLLDEPTASLDAENRAVVIDDRGEEGGGCRAPRHLPRRGCERQGRPIG
jgi:alpha-D-ribose 1-methylphosphonate 5-triphosphate synthase subunit PhnL